MDHWTYIIHSLTLAPFILKFCHLFFLHFKNILYNFKSVWESTIFCEIMWVMCAWLFDSATELLAVLGHRFCRPSMNHNTKAAIKTPPVPVSYAVPAVPDSLAAIESSIPVSPDSSSPPVVPECASPVVPKAERSPSMFSDRVPPPSTRLPVPEHLPPPVVPRALASCGSCSRALASYFPSLRAFIPCGSRALVSCGSRMLDSHGSAFSGLGSCFQISCP